MSNEDSVGMVSPKITPNPSSVGVRDSGGLNFGVNGVDLRAKLGEEGEYLSDGIHREFHKDWVSCVPPMSVLCFLCVKQDSMASDREAEMDLVVGAWSTGAGAGGTDAGAVGTGVGLGAPAVGPAGVKVATGAATTSPTPTGRRVRESSNSPMQDMGKAKVGGPTGLALTATPAAAAPSQLCRNGKSREALSSKAFSKPIVINLEAAMRAVAGKLAVAWVLSPYPVDPKMVVNELRGPWRLRGDAVAQRVTSEDRRFVITFMEEGGRLHVLHAGPWHFRDDAVVLAAFDGKGSPADVPLDSIKIRAQIWGLPVPIKTVEMGYLLGDKLGKVVAVSHKNKMIVDEHLRVRVEHRVDEPLRKFIDTVETTLDGNTIETLYDVKYEKLPNFCFCCGVLEHTTATFCSIPKELRVPSYSTDTKAPAHWKRVQAAAAPVRRHLLSGGCSVSVEALVRETRDKVQLPEKVVAAISTAVQELTVAASPLLIASAGGGKPVQSSLEDHHTLGSGAAREGGPPQTDPSKGRRLGAKGAILELSKTLADHESQLALLAPGAEVQTATGAVAGQVEASPGDAMQDGGPAATDGSLLGPAAAVLRHARVNDDGVQPGADARLCTNGNKVAGGGGHSLAAPGGPANLARWKRLHREEQEERAAVQAACAKHVQFGVPTPPNSGSDLSSRKAAFAEILVSSAGNKRRYSEGQDLVISFNSTSSESIEFRGASVALPACKKVCGERVETLVGIDGNMVHVTKEVDGGEEEVQGRRRESVGREKRMRSLLGKLPTRGLSVN